jgi:hypothetical protein
LLSLKISGSPPCLTFPHFLHKRSLLFDAKIDPKSISFSTSPLSSLHLKAASFSSLFQVLATRYVYSSFSYNPSSSSQNVLF